MAAFEKVADLGSEVRRLALLRPSIDASGRALLACTSSSSRAVACGRVTRPGEPEFSRGVAATTYPLTVFRHEDGHWEPLLELVGEFVQPHVQPLPDDELLVAGTYSQRGPDGRPELNGAVYGAGGALKRRFLLGDGIDDVQATPGGELWVSYFDQGVMGDYGRRGWGRLNPDEWIDPVGFAGLVRFDATGTVLFKFAPPSGFSMIADCYALNSWRDEVWASYHPRFPVVRVGSDGQIRGWATGLGGVIGALAVEGDRILLHGCARQSRHRCWHGHLDGAAVRDLVEVALTVRDDAPIDSLRWVVGRGSTLHAFGASSYYQLDIHELA